MTTETIIDKDYLKAVKLGYKAVKKLSLNATIIRGLNS